MLQEASVTARDLANRKEILHQLQSSITSEFKLKKIRVGSQQGQSLLSVSDVLEQIDSLKIVQVLPATGCMPSVNIPLWTYTLYYPAV